MAQLTGHQIKKIRFGDRKIMKKTGHQIEKSGFGDRIMHLMNGLFCNCWNRK